MNDIQPFAPTRIEPIYNQTRGERSHEWLELFFQTAKAAEVLATTDFVPPSMRGKPAQVAAAIMKGYELDIDPLDALANVYSVNGRIGFYAEFMRRRIIQFGHELTFVENNDTRVVIAGRRKGTEKWERAIFTAGQAHKAKIDLGAYPEDKLVARATSRLCKRVFPDVLAGTAIAEDLMDEQASSPTRTHSEDEDEPAAEPGTMQRKRQPRHTERAALVAVPPGSSRTEADQPPLPGDETPIGDAAGPSQEVTTS